MVKWQDEHTVVELVVETDFFNTIWVENVVLFRKWWLPRLTSMSHTLWIINSDSSSRDRKPYLSEMKCEKAKIWIWIVYHNIIQSTVYGTFPWIWQSQLNTVQIPHLYTLSHAWRWWVTIGDPVHGPIMVTRA